MLVLISFFVFCVAFVNKAPVWIPIAAFGTAMGASVVAAQLPKGREGTYLGLIRWPAEPQPRWAVVTKAVVGVGSLFIEGWLFIEAWG